MSAATEKIADHNARVHAANAQPDDPAVAARIAADAQWDDEPCADLLRPDVRDVYDAARVVLANIEEHGKGPWPPRAKAWQIMRAYESRKFERDVAADDARIAADALLRETTAERDALRAEVARLTNERDVAHAHLARAGRDLGDLVRKQLSELAARVMVIHGELGPAGAVVANDDDEFWEGVFAEMDQPRPRRRGEG